MLYIILLYYAIIILYALILEDVCRPTVHFRKKTKPYHSEVIFKLANIILDKSFVANREAPSDDVAGKVLCFQNHIVIHER